MTHEMNVDWRELAMNLSTSVVIVIDNAPCHSGIEDIIKEEEFKENYILRLAPYSPMLNPIENVWSVLNCEVKNDISNNIQYLLNEEHFGINQKEYRLRELENFIRKSLEIITPSLCIRCIAGIQKIIPKVITL